METVDLSIMSLALSFLLLALPVGLSLIYGFSLIKPLFYSVFRMTVPVSEINICQDVVFQFITQVFHIGILMLNLTGG